MGKKKQGEVLTDVDDAIRALEPEREFGLDLETGGLSPWKDPIAVVAIHGPEADSRTVLHVKGTMPQRLVHFLSQPGRTMITHNGTAFDSLFLHQYGVDVFNGPKHYDTLIGECATITSGRRDVSMSLKATAKRRTGKVLDKDIDHSGWMKNDVLTDQQMDYVLGDIGELAAIRRAQLAKVDGTAQRRAVLTEMALIPAVLHMALNGLPVDLGLLDTYIDKQHQIRADMRVQIENVLGPINLRSPSQIKMAMRQIGIALESTDVQTLKGLAEMGGRPGQIADWIVTLRHADQRIKMYTPEWVQKHCNKDTDGNWWVNARYWQVGTDTGRFSSSDPNLQQVPGDARWIFRAPAGYRIITLDYSQIEVRCAAWLAKDQALLEACASGDVHTAICAQVFGVKPEEIRKDDPRRKASKAASFTLLFGGGAGTLYNYARMSGSLITFEECKEIVKRFFNTYRGVSEMRDQAMTLAKWRGAVPIVLPTGLKRVLAGEQLTGTRILNTTVQGTAAAGLKYGILEARQMGIDPYLCGQIHDELVLVVPVDRVEEIADQGEQAMIKGMLRVVPGCPVAVDVKVGQSWGEALPRDQWSLVAA